MLLVKSQIEVPHERILQIPLLAALLHAPVDSAFAQAYLTSLYGLHDYT